MREFIKNLKTPIAIIGMAKSGEAAFQLLQAAGISKDDILTFDEKLEGVDFQNPESLLVHGQPQTLLVSPGVPLASAWIQEARARGIKITSELSVASSLLTTERLIGVTGSLGKSTTVSLLGAGLRAFSPNSFVGGNLGTPLAQYALEVLQHKRARADWIVLELSSYQLENCENLRLELSAITYLTSNHLERYQSLEHYYQTKWSILGLTREKLFLSEGGGDLISFAAKCEPSPKTALVSRGSPTLANFELNKALLLGQHNQDNLALATSIALAAGWPRQAIDGLKQFKGLDHRMENLGTVKGVRFINDSKATAIESVLTATRAAVETLSDSGRLLLLLGGRDKNLPWQDLSPLGSLPEVEFIFFGECRELAQKKSGLQGLFFPSLELALSHVFSVVKPKDTVLLSPGGTSLDEFKSFEARGDLFRSRVNAFAKV